MPFIRYVQGDYITLPGRRRRPPRSTGRRSPASTAVSTTPSSTRKSVRSPPAASSMRPIAGCSIATCIWRSSRSCRPVSTRRGARRARRRQVGGQAALIDPASGRSAFDLPGGQGPRQGQLLDAFPPKVGKRRPIRREMAKPERRSHGSSTPFPAATMKDRSDRQFDQPHGGDDGCVITTCCARHGRGWLELIFWPAMQIMVWGFLHSTSMRSKSSMASTGGILPRRRAALGRLVPRPARLHASRSWRRSGRAISANLMMSPLRPAELAASLMVDEPAPTSDRHPSGDVCWRSFFGFNIYGLGLPARSGSSSIWC